MNKKLLILAGVSIAFIASTFAAPNGGKRENRLDPEEMVARVIENNDANEDSALNAEELQEALIQMHDRRMERMEKRHQRMKDRMANGPRGKGKQRRDPSEMAECLIEEFDLDESGSLDSEELLEAFGSRMHRGPHGKMGPLPAEDVDPEA